MLMAGSAPGQNLFVTAADNGNIYEVAQGGTSSSTFATGMDNPIGLAFNSSGDLFVANTDYNSGYGSIVEITPGGVQSTFASGISPQGLAINNAGDVFEADYNSGNINEYTSSGAESTFATGFSFPLGLALDSAGDLFVGSGYGNGNGVVTEITTGGVQTTVATGLSFPSGLAVNSAEDLFVVNNGTGVINEFANGKESIFASGLNDPTEIAFNNAGTLFAAEGNGVIAEFSSNGTPSTYASLSGLTVGLAFQPVPEPSILALAAVGGVALLFRRRKS